MKWLYRGCFVPVYGWPLPNRRYSECCSLEYAVDWQAYALDFAVYAAIILVALLVLRLLLRRHWKFVNVVLTVIVIFAPLRLLEMSEWYTPLGVAEPLRPAGVSVAPSSFDPCPDNGK
ncbi:hypothetical protein [Sphingomonas sp.]|uniref:hypothetical protein n=1 Tax=Sphingomonas sp. TaxID=28214 RepID=UPI0025D6CD73|nr:hypothetical protein [Sphingomonas sp.]